MRDLGRGASRDSESQRTGQHKRAWTSQLSLLPSNTEVRILSFQRPSPSWWLHVTGMAFRSLRKILLSCRRFTYTSKCQRKVYNCKTFLVNALRKWNQYLIRTHSTFFWAFQDRSFSKRDRVVPGTHEDLGHWEPVKGWPSLLVRGFEWSVHTKSSSQLWYLDFFQKAWSNIYYII